MSWNYRIIRHIQNEEESFSVHEVYYDKDGQEELVTVEPIAVHGETADELKENFNLQMKSFDLPILDYVDFEKGGKFSTGQDAQ